MSGSTCRQITVTTWSSSSCKSFNSAGAPCPVPEIEDLRDILIGTAARQSTRKHHAAERLPRDTRRNLSTVRCLGV